MCEGEGSENKFPINSTALNGKDRDQVQLRPAGLLTAVQEQTYTPNTEELNMYFTFFLSSKPTCKMVRQTTLTVLCIMSTKFFTVINITIKLKTTIEVSIFKPKFL